MFFRKLYTITSGKNPEDLRKNLVGQHFTLHGLDFEICEKEEGLRVIPHAENDDHVYTLPITRLSISGKQDGSTIKMLSKPRRIDIGGPYLLMIFICFAIIAGILLILYGQGQYNITSYILIGASIVAYAILWLRMERGYFDYIRKIKRWIQQQA